MTTEMSCRTPEYVEESGTDWWTPAIEKRTEEWTKSNATSVSLSSAGMMALAVSVAHHRLTRKNKAKNYNAN
jgi:hypothetical protein